MQHYSLVCEFYLSLVEMAMAFGVAESPLCKFINSVSVRADVFPLLRIWH